MKYYIFLSYLLLSTAGSYPTQTKRGCTVVSPTVELLQTSAPCFVPSGDQIILDRSGDPVNTTALTALSFNIPYGSWGCMLKINIPPLTEPNEIANGDTRAEIWATDPWDLNSLPTWDRPPVKRQIVSTLEFPTQTNSQAAQSVLVSADCTSTMSYLLQLGPQNGKGGVSFHNHVGADPVLGFSMIHNC